MRDVYDIGGRKYPTSFRGDAKHRTRNLEIPGCEIAHLRSGGNAPSWNDIIPYPPRTGGISTWSRRQARRSISSQARNCRSLPMQIRTSLSRVLSQVTAIAALLSPGLALMKASSISAGATVFGSDNWRYSPGILTAERALRMVSK